MVSWCAKISDRGTENLLCLQQAGSHSQAFELEGGGIDDVHFRWI
jgi:hypothetical protein